METEEPLARKGVVWRSLFDAHAVREVELLGCRCWGSSSSSESVSRGRGVGAREGAGDGRGERDVVHEARAVALVRVVVRGEAERKDGRRARGRRERAAVGVAEERGAARQRAGGGGREHARDLGGERHGAQRGARVRGGVRQNDNRLYVYVERA